MLTREVLFGMNILSLAGFVMMGLGMTLNRQGKIRAPAAFVMMGIGTALVFVGLYVTVPASS